MKGIQEEDCHNHHHTFQANEQILVLDESTGPSFAQFCNPIHRTDEDADSSEGKSAQECLEGPALSQLRVSRIQRLVADCSHSPQGLDGEIGAQDHEDQQGKDLEREPSNHDMVTIFGTLVLVTGDTGHSAPNSLEKERHHIARNEDPRVRKWSNARVLSAKRVDNAR